MTGANETEEFATDKRLTMGIDPYERNWMRLSVALLVGFFAVVVVAGFAMGIQVNGAESEVDPRNVTDSEPWATPGLREISDGVYEAYVVASAWTFSPRELEIPVGSKVTIYVTSVDLQHGFKITDTNVNFMVIPGQVSKLDYTFDTVGEFPYICHEYCGSGHASMFGTVNVVPQSSDEAAAPTDDDKTDDGADE